MLECQEKFDAKHIKVINKAGQESDISKQELFLCKRILEELGRSTVVNGEMCQRCQSNKGFFDSYIKSKLLKNPRVKPPYKQLTIREMAENFVKASSRAIKEGFKKVVEKTYIERLVCCSTCGADERCIYCGCYLKGERFSKTCLSSETGCPNPKTYPNLIKPWLRFGYSEEYAIQRAYPPRNYWGVCDEMTSVIIPARNEIFLNKTIENILKNSTGKIEIIVVLDGYEFDVIKDDRIKIIKHKEPLGIRASINESAKIANGQYLFKLDGHCTMSEGWDTKLKCACDEKTIAVSVIRPLDKETFSIPEKATFMSFCYLDADYNWQWWNNYKPKGRKIPNLIEETMTFIGLAFMVRKDYFEQIGGFDDLSLGKYGLIGPELSLKTWLHPQYPGKVVIRLDTICGHLFYQSADESPNKEYSILDQWRRYVLNRYNNIELSKLFGKFPPIPQT